MTTTYKINGKVVSYEKWLKSEKKGVHQAYYPNGQIEWEYNYQNDEAHGLCRNWYNNGRLRYEAIFVNDIDRTEEFKDNKLLQVVVFGKVIL